MVLHLKKLAVGISDLDHLAHNQPKWYMTWRGQTVMPVWTRHKPTREDEIIKAGGSLYRIVKNRIQCRQRILGMDVIDDPKEGRHCLIYTDPEIIQTFAAPHKPFQGWRYLEERDAPKDRGIFRPGAGTDHDMPEEMKQELQALGLM